MSAYDVEQGDEVHPGNPVTVDRYTGGARINHWITATCLVLLALSGLALFHPSLFFLTGLFGGGQTTRAIHPWLGVILFFSFGGLFIRFWRANLWKAEDGTWMARLRDVLVATRSDCRKSANTMRARRWSSGRCRS
jgi:formate dehydrogenase subunit gamma